MDNEGWASRRAYFASGETPEFDMKFRTDGVTFIAPLYTDYSTLDKLIIPGQKLTVQIKINEGKFHMWKVKNQDGKSRLTVTNAYLHVLQYQPTEQYRMHIMEHLKREASLYHFDRKYQMYDFVKFVLLLFC